MKNETLKALQDEIDRLDKEQVRSFARGMLLGFALTMAGIFVGLWIGG